MKMFSDCSGECCVCACAGGCLAGHGDDGFSLANKEQIIKRLDNGEYKDYTQMMKDCLKNTYGYDYDDKQASTKQTRTARRIQPRTAHWIIENRGYSGSDYKCSECGVMWNDNYTNISMEEVCPNCGAVIDDDENEYIEHKKTELKPPVFPTLHLGKFIKRTDVIEAIGKYEEAESKLIKVSGYDVEKLIELFAAGYTLQPPNYKDISILDPEK